ncbi:MAG: hypothetical protein NVS2B17_13770 [Candidatus Velthaea sp.]
MKSYSAWRQLRHTLGERAIDVASLSPPLRFAFGAACAQILAAAFLLAVRSVPSAHAAQTLVTPTGYNIPTVTFDAVLAGTVIAWTFFLAGAFLAHPFARGLALVSFTLFANEFASLTEGPGHIVAIVLLVVLWIGFVVSLARRPRDFTAMAFAVGPIIAAIGVATYAGSWRAVSFAMDFTIALSSLTYILIAVLLMAGGELGDWSNLAGVGVAALFHRVGTRASVVVTVLAALGLGVFALATPAFWRVPLHYYIDVVSLVVVSAIVIVILAYSLKRNGVPRHVHIPWLALLAGSLLYAAPTVGGPIVHSMTDPVYGKGFSHYHAPEKHVPFSVDVPTLWHELDVCRAVASEFLIPYVPEKKNCRGAMRGAAFLSLLGKTQFVVEAYPENTEGVKNVDAFIRNEARPGRVISAIETAGVHEYRVSRKAGIQHALVWVEHEDGRTWLIEGSDFEPNFAASRQLLERMHSSFKAGESEPVRFDYAEAFGTVLMLLVGIVATLVLRRRFSVGFAFLLVFSALYIVENLPHAVAAVTGGTGQGVPTVQFWTIQFGIALVSLGCIIQMILRKLPVARTTLTLLSAIAGIAAIQGFFTLYGFAVAAGSVSRVQAAVVLVALAWDVLMSGESITNADSPAFPRAARLGMFLGYVMFVSLAILYFGSMVDLNGATVAEFESESFVQVGIFTLGVPVLLTAVLIRSFSGAAATENA